jgi:hypothetical protein
MSHYSYSFNVQSLVVYRLRLQFSVPAAHYLKNEVVRETLPCLTAYENPAPAVFDVKGSASERRFIPSGAVLTIRSGGRLLYRRSWSVLVP